MAVMAITCTSMQAHGFKNKFTKTMETVVSTTDASTAIVDTSTTTSEIDTMAIVKALPDYMFMKVTEIDDDGNVITNDDGTARYKVLIFDVKGECFVTAKAARKYIKSVLNSSIISTLINTGFFAGAGAKSDKSVGALIGAGIGMLASSVEIIVIVKQVKKLRAFNKQIDIYNKNFSEEGFATKAEISAKDLKALHMDELEEVTLAQSVVVEQIQNSKITEDGDIDFDALISGSSNSES